VVVYDANWQPYCDRGHWVNTDTGWYWNSDYAWGVAFHYGRWFRHPGYGWCWWPDTVWAPSWVTWRSADDYCGWAPLPPFSTYRPGVGFFYRGVSVGVNFDFGLDAGAFLFVSAGHFCEPHPRYFCVDRARSVDIFRRTTIINNFEVDRHANVVVNRGIPVERISAASHRTIVTVSVNRVPNAERQVWHNGGFSSPAVRPETHNYNNGGRYTAPGATHEAPPANNNHSFYNNNNGNPGYPQGRTATAPWPNTAHTAAVSAVPAARQNPYPAAMPGGSVRPEYNQTSQALSRPAAVESAATTPEPAAENPAMARTGHGNLTTPAAKTSTPRTGTVQSQSRNSDKNYNGQGH
jgi:hypothetical protein